MPTVITGSGGVDKVQPNSVGTAALQAGAVTPAKTQVGALPSMVRMSAGNGHGSTNICIRRFINTVINQGTDITYADSATLGASFTVNTAGVYAITYIDNFGTASNHGISLNTTQPTTTIGNINYADSLADTYTYGSDTRSTVAWTGYLPAGSVIRPHTAGNGGGNARSFFTITRVA